MLMSSEYSDRNEHDVSLEVFRLNRNYMFVSTEVMFVSTSLYVVLGLLAPKSTVPNSRGIMSQLPRLATVAAEIYQQNILCE